jgi:hypothetical protein
MAEDLAGNSVEAAGGWGRHAVLTSFRALGVTRVGDQSVSFILHAARPRSVRIETLGEKGSLVRAFDGVLAPWKKDDLAGPPRRLGRAEELEFIAEADFDQPLYDHAARGVRLDYAGETTLDGRLYHKLLASLRLNELVVLYLDDETRMLARRDQTRRIGGREVMVSTYYSDYREVAGVKLPHRIRVELDGRLANETEIESYAPNPPLPPGFFSPPVKDWPRF